ncbi:MAG: hypothetical protein JW941_04100, partial [Candidatus Coatesbacteria bacterium]|nr:hypothetical protein [Candidatus Coatesbacteria bacterium]
KKRPFIGIRPARIRPGEVFDLSITVCDPDSFDNLLITRDDGLRTPEVTVKVNDVDISAALNEKFSGFNPFGYPSNVTAHYPGFRLLWPQMKIDEEMPLKIEVQVRDALGNVNQVVERYSIQLWEDPVFGLDEFPMGLYSVPLAGLQDVKACGFNIVTPDNWTATCGTGTYNTTSGYLDNKMPFWLQVAKLIGLRTLPGWINSGDWACPANSRLHNERWGTGWQDRIYRIFREMPEDPNESTCDVPGPLSPPEFRHAAVRDCIDIVALPDEPMPILTSAYYGDIPAERQREGCSLEEQIPCAFAHPVEGSWLGFEVWLEDYIRYRYNEDEPAQVFFGQGEISGNPRWGEARVKNTVEFFRDVLNPPWVTETFWPGHKMPLFLNHLYVHTRSRAPAMNKPIWAAFMQYCNYYSVDVYPDMGDRPLTEIAYMLDLLHECRRLMWAGGSTYLNQHYFQVTIPDWTENWGETMREFGLPKLWFVIRFGDWWTWTPEIGKYGRQGSWTNEMQD